MKKAIVAVTGPFRLYQAIFLTYLFPEYSWDVILISYEKKQPINSKFEDVCRRSKRFNKIFVTTAGIQFAGNTKLLWECVKMTFYFIAGKREVYAKKLLLQSIENFDYDMICVACSYSLIEGALISFSKKKKVIVMEEGVDDYIYCPGKAKIFKGLKGIGAKLLFKMQYINLLYDNHYTPLKYCEKYVRYPELIRENHYKKVNKILDFSQVDQKAFQETIKNSFEIGEESYDIIIYTAPLWYYELEGEYTKFIHYIKNKYINKKILVKRHPLDNYEYDFSALDVTEKYVEIPGEMILQQWENAVHIFVYPSTILLGIGLENINFKVIKFTSSNQLYNSAYTDEHLNFFRIPEKNIIKI